MTNFRLIIVIASALSLVACGNATNEETAAGDENMQPAASMPASVDMSTIESVEIVPGLSRKIVREGDGAVAEIGHTAVVHYTGWLFDAEAPNNRGSKFDSSVDRDAHFRFPLGGGRVISGWDKGVEGMHVGELRELTIAPEMAYGDRQVGDLIPPGSTLVFEVELVDLEGFGMEGAATP